MKTSGQLRKIRSTHTYNTHTNTRRDTAHRRMGRHIISTLILGICSPIKSTVIECRRGERTRKCGFRYIPLSCVVTTVMQCVTRENNSHAPAKGGHTCMHRSRHHATTHSNVHIGALLTQFLNQNPQWWCCWHQASLTYIFLAPECKTRRMICQAVVWPSNHSMFECRAW